MEQKENSTRHKQTPNPGEIREGLNAGKLFFLFYKT
jgi:hypothetical protein